MVRITPTPTAITGLIHSMPRVIATTTATFSTTSPRSRPLSQRFSWSIDH